MPAALIFWVAGTLLMGIAFAESKVEGLSLRELIQEAIDNNPELKAAKYEALIKEAEIGPRGAYEDPMIEFEAMNYPVDSFSPREFGMTGQQLSLTQKVPFPGKLTLLRRAARLDYQAKQQGFSVRQLELIRNVKLAYYELFIAQKRQEILIERKNLIRQLVVVTRNKYTLGKVSQAELLSLQVEEANLMSQLLTAEKEIQARGAELGALLGHQSAKVPGRVARMTKTPFDFNKLTEQLLTDRIFAQNPALKGAAADLNVAEVKSSYAKWNYLPDFEFAIGYTFRQPNMDDRGVDVLSGAIEMSLPLWALSKQSEEVKGARAEQIRADAMLMQQRAQLIKQIHTKYAELSEASKKLQLFEGGLLPLARQSVVTGQSAYLTGKLEYVSLLTFINVRYQTEMEYNEALVTYENKIAEFEALLGEPIGALE
ncbi:MAG: hypothetical protein A2070_03325 [Bdellovibrionales bacterium GWC1_52_8]|nr:MAG: hypothetical protein A2X97_11885 [Bdellovibrionales bacterium GWA1_52_35]OFZ36852.1 MAG: hypothetical protein A2070_03325 [Bdellovibrionales bacterium GWC1_52_8]